MSQEQSKTMPMQIFLGVKEVYYGIVQVENGFKFLTNLKSKTNQFEIVVK